MRSPKSLTIFACLGFVFSALSGCGSSADLPETASKGPGVEQSINEIDTKPASIGTSQESTSTEQNTPELNEDQARQQSSDQEAKSANYEPPFPNRVDLFTVPRREGRGIETQGENSEKAVELIGFVNVNSPQVVLSVDGIVTPLDEGSQIAGIEVISIQPPAVVLQRGRQRWRTALGN